MAQMSEEEIMICLMEKNEILSRIVTVSEALDRALDDDRYYSRPIGRDTLFTLKEELSEIMRLFQ